MWGPSGGSRGPREAPGGAPYPSDPPFPRVLLGRCPPSVVPACVVLAAGASRRSGAAPKALLTIPGGATVLRHVVEGASSAGLSPVVVVVGAHAAALQQELAYLPRARLCPHPGWEHGRTGSVKRGLEMVGEGHGGTVLWPIDHPFVRLVTLAALQVPLPRDASAPGPAWVVPTFRGRRGHPVLMSDLARAEVLTYSDDEPLFRYPRSHPPSVLEVAVEDAGVLENIDTPEAFSSAVARWEGKARDPRSASAVTEG